MNSYKKRGWLVWLLYCCCVLVAEKRLLRFENFFAAGADCEKNFLYGRQTIYKEKRRDITEQMK
jgi:hypothetical protein